MGINFFNLHWLFIILFTFTILGLLINQSNTILVLILIEVMFLFIVVLTIIYSNSLDLNNLTIFSLYIISVVAVESAIGLSLIIIFYKLKGALTLQLLSLLKG